MALDVVAETEAQFERWLDAQRKPAAEPANESEARGRDAFMRRQCVLCHSIRGTLARGLVGPDLTHLASRGKLRPARCRTLEGISAAGS